jgi:hypothetical protein
MHVEVTFHATVREAAGRGRPERDLPLADGRPVGDAPVALLRDATGATDAEPLVPDPKGELLAHVALRRDGEDVRDGERPTTLPADGGRFELEPSVEGVP